jgi:hypothetical protein
MASVLINIPGTGPVDPLSIKNAHYEYQQATTDTVDNTATLLYLDLISENGVYLYEVRVVGIESEVSNAVFKRSFTAYKNDSGLFILTPQSDYTQKTDPTWSLQIMSEGSGVALKVVGSASAQIHWVATVTKTIGL